MSLLVSLVISKPATDSRINTDQCFYGFYITSDRFHATLPRRRVSVWIGRAADPQSPNDNGKIVGLLVFGPGTTEAGSSESATD